MYLYKLKHDQTNSNNKYVKLHFTDNSILVITFHDNRICNSVLTIQPALVCVSWTLRLFSLNNVIGENISMLHIMFFIRLIIIYIYIYLINIIGYTRNRQFGFC